ncbi:hypothetical protein GGS20DRAFT_586691 [Poronia punctata]|nr:hypothetical protein GGS20DRAFT_586691 [Poronia punctata]
MNVVRHVATSPWKTKLRLEEARKVVCIGRNYADHIAELNSARPKQPFFFLKPPSSILRTGKGPVIRPRGVDLHYEIELALIMGKRVKNLDVEDEAGALDAIHSKSSVFIRLRPSKIKWPLTFFKQTGYALAIDMTARNVQGEAKKKGLPWSIAKGFDTFLPMSNFISKSVIPDPHNIELYLTVNNEVRQSDSTNLFLFRIPRLLGTISQIMTLNRGDIVLTGTPKGVGPVVPGDVMRGGIRVNGKEIQQSKIKFAVKESTGPYAYAET